MNTSLTRFGDPAQFEIAARWSPDPEARERLPLTGGWSTGELRITVCGQVLSTHRLHGQTHDSLSWYLSPVVDWLIRNWTWLLHEESYAWHDKDGQAAAIATRAALDRAMLALVESDSNNYAAIQAWWSRHALRAADASAVYPDIYFRRLADEIEISWLAHQPEFAPNDFLLMLSPGYALLPVQAVAQPLWDFIHWALKTAPAATPADHDHLAQWVQRCQTLQATPLSQLEQIYLGERVQELLTQARAAGAPASQSTRLPKLPAIESLDAAVLMFGGVNVELSPPDVSCLLGFLTEQSGGTDAPALAELISPALDEPWLPPYEEGYRLAQDCRDALGIAPDQIRIDLPALLTQLQIPVKEVALNTTSIRGVAVAGKAFAPAILVNTHSPFNHSEAGRRFTLAHELCHILHDRTRARKLSHLSGPWASPRTEKRANAFAAMFLAPTSAIKKSLSSPTPEAVRQLAQDVGMSASALIEHLYNIDLISETQREMLRPN